MKKDFLIVLFALASLYIFHSCAQIGQIEGGPKDSIPPQWIASRPLNYTTNFDQKKVKLYFDEYFKVNDAQSKVVISPPTKEEPELKLWSKKLTVILPDSLKENTTYTLQFNDAIADFTENNPMEDLTFVFSTGSVIDTMAVGGQLFDAKTLEPIESCYVAVYEEMQDSTPYLRQPDYITKTDTAGRFLISHIHPANYHVFALNDLNRNILFDMPAEPIAFLDSIITPTAQSVVYTDSLVSASGERDSIITRSETMLFPNHLQLFLFEEEHRQPYVSEYNRDERHLLRLVFNRLLDDTLQVNFLQPDSVTPTEPWFTKEVNLTNDTVRLWLTDTTLAAQDTLQLEVVYNTLDSLENVTQRMDTLRFTWEVNPKDTTNFIDFSNNLESNTINFGENISMQLGELIDSIHTSRINIFELKDTTVTDKREQGIARYQRPKIDSLIFWMKRPLPENPHFTIAGIAKQWFQYSLNDTRDKIKLQITDSAVFQTDSIEVEAHFSNLFYNEVVVRDRTALKIPFTPQRIRHAERVSNEHCFFILEKTNVTEWSIEPRNFSGANWLVKQEQVIENESIRVDFWVNESTAAMHNIALHIKVNDQTAQGNDTTLLLPVGFVNKEQELEEFERGDSVALQLQFAIPLLEEPKLEPLNFRSHQNWFDAEFNVDSTRFIAKLTDPKNIEQDSLSVRVSYSYLDSLLTKRSAQKKVLFITRTEEETKKLKLQTDSLKAIKQIEQDSIKQALDSVMLINEFEIQALEPVAYTLKEDSVYMRKYHLLADLAPEKKYRMVVDSMAFTTIWGGYNDSLQVDFTMKTVEDYGTLKLSLINCPDNAILEILDEKGERSIRIVGKVKDGVSDIELLLPEEYQLRIIEDTNGNGKWDTGNFLQKLQPERVYRFKSVIKIKEAWIAEETWDVTDDKHSFGPEEKKEKKKKK